MSGLTTRLGDVLADAQHDATPWTLVVQHLVHGPLTYHSVVAHSIDPNTLTIREAGMQRPITHPTELVGGLAVHR